MKPMAIRCCPIVSSLHLTKSINLTFNMVSEASPVAQPFWVANDDMAKEEWDIDGYGSMKGLIRLQPAGNKNEDEGSSESDMEEHVEVERRLDHDLSRFEMIYPNPSHNVLENRVDDQDTHIAQIEVENLSLKEKLFLMERELGDLRRRLLFLETHTLLITIIQGDEEEDRV